MDAAETCARALTVLNGHHDLPTWAHETGAIVKALPDVLEELHRLRATVAVLERDRP